MTSCRRRRKPWCYRDLDPVSLRERLQHSFRENREVETGHVPEDSVAPRTWTSGRKVLRELL